MASVIDLHIPDPPPVQNKTFPLNISGLNTSIELVTGATTGLEDIVGRSKCLVLLLACQSMLARRSPPFPVDFPFT